MTARLGADAAPPDHVAGIVIGALQDDDDIGKPRRHVRRRVEPVRFEIFPFRLHDVLPMACLSSLVGSLTTIAFSSL